MCADGQTYDRIHIETWLANHNTSPLTGAVLPNNALVPNIALRQAIQAFVATQEAAAAAAAAAADGDGM